MNRQEKLIVFCAALVVLTQLLCTDWVGRTVWRVSPDLTTCDLTDLQASVDALAKATKKIDERLVTPEERMQRFQYNLPTSPR